MVTVWIAGDIDAHAADSLHLDLLALAEKGHDIRLDLGHATLFSSRSCLVLVEMWRLARRRGGDLRVVRSSLTALRMLQATSLDHLLATGAAIVRPSAAPDETPG